VKYVTCLKRGTLDPEEGSRRFLWNTWKFFIFKRLEIFTVMNFHVVVFWVMKPCSDVLGYQPFGGSCCLHLHLHVISSDTTTRCLNPEEYLNFHRRENLKPYIWNLFIQYLHVSGFHQASYPMCTGDLFLGLKSPEREADHSPPSRADARECVKLYVPSPNTSSWRGAQLSTETNYTHTHTLSLSLSLTHSLTHPLIQINVSISSLMSLLYKVTNIHDVMYLCPCVYLSTSLPPSLPTYLPTYLTN